MSSIVITVTKVRTNSIAGSSLLYRSFGEVFENTGVVSRGVTSGAVATGTGTLVAGLSGTGFGTMSLGLSTVSAGWSSGSGFS